LENAANRYVNQVTGVKVMSTARRIPALNKPAEKDTAEDINAMQPEINMNPCRAGCEYTSWSDWNQTI
jgi:hypothetical protein